LRTCHCSWFSGTCPEDFINTDERLAIVKPGADIFCFASADGVCRFEASLAEVNPAEVRAPGMSALCRTQRAPPVRYRCG
ncbi:hypothetical protein, partial [Enterobacter ludwigii]|uniref:hypothetical protein n=1 Tax=Enterobacter ludwigii TaxID=299767 RepID=UPI0039753B21